MKKGDIVQAKIIEHIANQVFIVNFNGSLLRVTNTSGETFRPNQLVELVVLAVDPLAFQLIGKKSNKNISFHV
ncbi:MAG: hypothetical protein KDD58_07725 [Bdellovibrionales bacterium]|nr:hypothetical protein [Bdellovibrionales bacterium]